MKPPKIKWTRQKLGRRDGWMWKMPGTRLRFNIHRFNKGKKSQKVYVYLYVHDVPYHEICLWNYKGYNGFFGTPKEAKRFVKHFVKAMYST